MRGLQACSCRNPHRTGSTSSHERPGFAIAGFFSEKVQVCRPPLRCRTTRQRRQVLRHNPERTLLAYSVLRLAIHFSKIAWLLGSVSVKAIPIPYFGLEYTTLPNAVRIVPPCISLSETFVPSGIGIPVIT